VTTTESRAVAADLFRGDETSVALVGTRCTACATTYFPRSLGCRNPECAGPAVEEALLGRTGELYSYTVQHYRPPPLFRMAEFAPYAIGLVTVPEGLRVLAMLTGCEPAALRIGMPLELTTHVLGTDEAGELLTYAYRPREEER
jgi:uncharacterized protein